MNITILKKEKKYNIIKKNNDFVLSNTPTIKGGTHVEKIKVNANIVLFDKEPVTNIKYRWKKKGFRVVWGKSLIQLVDNETIISFGPDKRTLEYKQKQYSEVQARFEQLQQEQINLAYEEQLLETFNDEINLF